MAFNRFSEFVRQRATGSHDVVIDTKEYSDTVYADLAAAALRNSPLIGAKDMVSLALLRVERKMAEIDYQNHHAVCAAVSSGNEGRLAAQLGRLERHVTDKAIFSEVTALCEKSFFDCQLPESCVPIDIDSVRNELKAVAEAQASKISCAVRDAMKSWPKTTIRLEAQRPSDGLICQSFRCAIGDAYGIRFDINESLDVTNVEFADENSQVMKESFSRLVGELSGDRKARSFGVYYMSYPRAMRHVMEAKRRDISLGIKCYIPRFSRLTSSPSFDEGSDTWRLRIEDNLLERVDESFFEAKSQAMLRSVDMIGDGNEEQY